MLTIGYLVKADSHHRGDVLSRVLDGRDGDRGLTSTVDCVPSDAGNSRVDRRRLVRG